MVTFHHSNNNGLFTELGKAQLEVQTATSPTSAIAEVALCANFFLFKIAKNAVFALCSKFQWWKFGCALTWYENDIPELRCASTESKSSLRKLRGASEIERLNCAFFAALLLGEKIVALRFRYNVSCTHRYHLITTPLIGSDAILIQ